MNKKLIKSIFGWLFFLVFIGVVLFGMLIVMQTTIGNALQEEACNELKKKGYNAYIVDTGVLEYGLVCYVEINGHKLHGFNIRGDLLKQDASSERSEKK